MAPGEPGLDLEFPDLESLAFFDRLCSGRFLTTRKVNWRTRGLGQAIQISHMIWMSVGQKDQLDRQAVFLRVIEHNGTSGATIEGYRFPARRVPDKISVDLHVVIRRVELSQALKLDLVRAEF